MTTTLVVLVSGSGTLFEALLGAARSGRVDAEIVAVGADRPGIRGLEIADTAGIDTFATPVAQFADRSAWDRHLTDVVASYRPSLVVSAGFMKILGPAFLDAHTAINTHPALLPAFPGAHAVRDALHYGVLVTGATIHLVDRGVDTGPILAQRAVEVRPGDTEPVLHERIKTVERDMLIDVVGQIAAGTIDLAAIRRPRTAP